MGVARFYTFGWPLVRIEWPKTITSVEFGQFEKDFDGLIARGERFAVVMSIEKSDRPSADVRRLIAEYQRTRAAELHQWVVGFAFVVVSPALRGVLTAIRWLVPAAYPEQHFRTREAAEDWAAQQLGLPLDSLRTPGASIR